MLSENKSKLRAVLVQKASLLEEKVKIIRKIINNLTWPEALGIESLSNADFDRVTLNNTRFGLENKTYSAVLHRFILGHELGLEDKYRSIIVLAFYRDGDQLARKIVDYFEQVVKCIGDAKIILSSNDIPERLLSRTMDEKSYFGYLSGDLPIGSLSGKVVYLPKDK